MRSSFASTAQRLRQRAFGPASRRAWLERLALAGIVAGAATLWLQGENWSAAQLTVGWAILGLALAVLFRRGWVRVFGPVLFYDLVRSARRAKTFVARGLYLGLLLLFLWSVMGGRDRGSSGSMNDAADTAEAFFITVMGVQFFLALLLTPVYIAPAISEEKERRTLEFILATDLDGREIVLGKLVARLGHLTLLLLAGLPVLSAVQFLGGVDPDLLLAGFAATALTMLGLGGVSILASVFARRSRDAIMLTYLAAGVYFALCLFGAFLVDIGALSASPLLGLGPSPADLVEALEAGNPGRLLSRVFGGGPIRQAIPAALRDYAIFHLVLAAGTVALAVAYLRPVALREAAGEGKKKRFVLARGARQPVGDRPMLWKELHHDSGPRLRKGGVALVVLLVVLSYVPIVFMLWDPATGGADSLSMRFNFYVRGVGTAVACILLLGVAMRAAVAVRIERDKDTLDALLTSPLETREILAAKWAGSLCAMRWPALWLASIWAAGLLTGGLSPLAVPLLVGVCFVYAGTLAALGLWFSVVCRTTGRATVATMGAALGVSVGHWLLWLCCIPLRLNGDFEILAKLQAGITPPAVLCWLLPFPLQWDRVFGISENEQMQWIAYAAIGTLIWIAFGALLWKWVNERFKSTTNRQEWMRSDRPTPLPSTGEESTEV